MITQNDDRKKLYADEPAPSIFDSPAVCKALSMRSSCNYPGSIIDQLKRSQGKKPSGTLQASARAGTGRRIVGTVSDTVVPSGDQCRSDSSSSSSIGTDVSNDDRAPGLTSEALEGAAGATRGGENSNSAASEAQNGGAQVEKTIVRRRNKKEEPTSSTDTESDEEVCTFECASRGKNVHAKSRKRKKKLTANLAGTRYDVGKN